MSGILPVIMAGRILNRCRTAGYKYWQNTSLRGKTLPAVVMQKHGAGTAIVSGLHIEDTGQNLKRILNSLLIKEPDAYGIASALEEGEAARRALFCKMMAKIRQ